MKTLICTALALACSLPAIAVPLASTPGSTLLPGTTSALRPELAGTVLEDRLTPFSFVVPPIFGSGGGTVSGSIQERVVRSTLDGTLDFYWRIFNDAASYKAIGTFDLVAFDTPRYDGDWRIDGLGSAAPKTGSHDGTNVNFKFTEVFDIIRIGGVAPGSSSNFFFLDTDALNYAQTATMTVNSACLGDIVFSLCIPRSSAAMSTFAPSLVPEVSSSALLLAGLGALGWVARRRRTL